MNKKAAPDDWLTIPRSTLEEAVFSINKAYKVLEAREVFIGRAYTGEASPELEWLYASRRELMRVLDCWVPPNNEENSALD